MSKNTRWALAIVGVAIIIVAAVVIGTGKDDTDATPVQNQGTETTSQTGPTGSTGGVTSGGGGTGGQGSGDDNGTGGASPDDSTSGNGSGGAGPQEETGGAKAQIGVVSPVLTASNPRTVKADKGEMVTIRARSDQSAELHIHGYDKTLELKPGKTGRVRFKATIDGEFSIELHFAGSEAEVGTLRVSP